MQIVLILFSAWAIVAYFWALAERPAFGFNQGDKIYELIIVIKLNPKIRS
jgi:hypothetical protein